MHESLIRILRHTPLRLIYFFMGLAIPFYVAFGKGYSSSYKYFRRRQGFGPAKSFAYVFLQFFRFGQVIIDRFACYAGREFKLELENYEAFNAACKDSRPFMMLTGHAGNYEIAGCNLNAEQKAINAVVFSQETEAILKNRVKTFSGRNINMIPVLDDMSHVFAINEAFHRGEIVSMPADRSAGSEKTIPASLLGFKAGFPKGPFVTAAVNDIKVFCVYAMREGTGKYRGILNELVLPPKDWNIRSKAEFLAGQFAANLGEIIRKYPEQWFNFFDFWTEGDEEYVSPAEASVEVILPQKKPFQMVDRLLSYDDKTAVCSLTVKEDNLFYDKEKGVLLPEGLIECAAQTCAARIGYWSKYIIKKGIRNGYIVAVQHFKATRLPKPGETIVITETEEENVMGLVLARAEIECGGEPVASMKLKLAIRED